MTVLTDAALNAAVWLSQATPTPNPTMPAFIGDEDTITPTWVGFAFTFGILALTVLLILDMTRRVRRVRYRGEIRERLEAEAVVEGLVPTDSDIPNSNSTDSSGPAAPPTR